jgi:adenosylcobinamide kinase/adenosylcobinamide-phosphate guanylyltransferase
MAPSRPHLTLVLGGARSGKSAFAACLALASGLLPVLVATAEAADAEMAARIERHRRERDARWTTVEAPHDLPDALADWASPDRFVIVDCLTLWLTNVLTQGRDPQVARDRLLAALAARRGPVALVSNEVGLGIVPLGELSRRFVDEAGFLHQAVAALADRVVLMIAGRPLEVGPA